MPIKKCFMYKKNNSYSCEHAIKKIKKTKQKTSMWGRNQKQVTSSHTSSGNMESGRIGLFGVLESSKKFTT